MHCPVCDAEAELRCSACHSVAYCSAEHQKEHWKAHKKNCYCFRVVETAQCGKGIVASKDLKAGTVVLEESPIVMATAFDPIAHLQPTCLACGEGKHFGSPRTNCSRCSWPVCGYECERRPIHAENECGIFAASKFPFLPPAPMKTDNIMNLVLLIRALMLKRRDPQSYEELAKLQSEFALVGHKYSWEVETRVVQSLMNIADFGVDLEELKKLRRIFEINCFTIKHMMGGVNSTGYVFLKGSRINHSCAPNCSMDMSPRQDFKIRICATVDVKKGDPLTFDYIPTETGYYGTKQRLVNLRSKIFQCKCARCLDPTELGTFASAITCAACRESSTDNTFAHLLPENPLSLCESARWKCNRCGNVKLASEILPTVEKISKIVYKKNDELQWGNGDALVKFCKGVIEKYSGKYLHPNHWVLLIANKVMFDFLTKTKKGKMDLELCQFYVKIGMDLLAIQNIITPGLSRIRASLLELLAHAVHSQICELVGLGRYDEALRNFQICDDFNAQTLGFYKLCFLDPSTAQRIESVEQFIKHVEHHKGVVMSNIRGNSRA